MRACGASSGMENSVLKSLAKSEFFRRVACRSWRIAAEDSRTPRRWRILSHATPSARFWSAAVLCRFHLQRLKACGTFNRIGYLFACVLLFITSSTWGAITFKALNSFSSATGAQPFGQLLRSTNGLFYGTTASGGENGLGAIYSATTGGALNLVASFDGTNGAQPLAGLIQGPDGNFYGTASVGGAFGKGTVFRATADGNLTNLFSFDGTNGARPLASLTFGADGNFYGTTAAGGALIKERFFGSMGTRMWRFCFHSTGRMACNRRADWFRLQMGRFMAQR